MGTWIAVAIVIFIIGTIMSLKPSPIDQRLDNMRMKARSLELHPKLLACPSWIRGTNNETGKGMLAQYRIVNDGFQLPLTRYQIINNEWRPIDILDNANTNFSLDKVTVGFSKKINPFIKGLSTQANCITLYWQDSCYIMPSTNKGFDFDDIEPDLMQLKADLLELAVYIQENS